jgi:imidazolonepropionase
MIPSNALGEQRMTDWDLLLTDARVVTLGADAPGLGIIEEGAVAISGERLAWVGPQSALPGDAAAIHRSVDGRWVTPALIDCHTHAVFGGDRAREFELRRQGASYQEIAAAGGGILSTVNATRSASDDELRDAALRRVLTIAASGVATIEIKSGYGLDIDTELRMLRIARRVGEVSGLNVRTTLLAAHAVPPEYAGRPDDYVDLISEQLIPEVARQGLADAVDAYCEPIAFTPEQVSKIFDSAVTAGLPVKLHADQLSDSGGAALAARYGALSADHLEYASTAGIEALAAAGSIAVLLPGAFVTLNETRKPPVELLRRHGVPIAIATDCNPGTSPLLSMTEAMALASRLFGLSPDECLAGSTRNAAMALGLEDRGVLEAGKRADLAIWDIEHPRDLCYWLGARDTPDLLIAGRSVNLT